MCAKIWHQKGVFDKTIIKLHKYRLLIFMSITRCIKNYIFFFFQKDNLFLNFHNSNILAQNASINRKPNTKHQTYEKTIYIYILWACFTAFSIKKPLLKISISFLQIFKKMRIWKKYIYTTSNEKLFLVSYQENHFFITHFFS